MRSLVTCCLTPLLLACSLAAGGQGGIAGTAGASQGSGGTAPAAASRRQQREAESSYVEGAKKLERGDLEGAEREFIHALQLNPGNQNYAIAISVAREHRVTELVRQSTAARLAGDAAKAQELLQAASALDPQNPIVLEHAQQPAASPVLAPSSSASSPWKVEPILAGPIRIEPAPGSRSFELRGAMPNVIRQVTSQYGIRSVLDDSVDSKQVRFEIQNVSYDDAMYALTTLTHTFAVPIDEHTLLIAHDDQTSRDRLQRLVQETIDVPGATPEKLQEIANVVRNVFNVRNAVVDAAAARLIVRAPAAVLEPLNQTLQPLLDTGGELMLDVKVYEIATSRTVRAGVQLPNQFTAFNVNQAANKIVSDNQALVQQAIAQGLVSSTATNLQIALALIGAGLVKSDLATNLIGVFGGGLLQTGVASSTSGATLNLARNASDTRTLDDVQLRVNDREEATFRAGTRYPILNASYSTGLSTPATALSNATINGVNVANLLQQFAGGTRATIPQVTYEDLGLTLKAKPAFQASGQMTLQLDLVIQAIAGSGLNGIPVLLNRHFTTALSVADGESTLLVSDVSRTETAAMTGLPGISELPGLRPPTERDTIKDSGQLVVVVTPHIVRRRADQIAGPRIALHLPPGQ